MKNISKISFFSSAVSLVLFLTFASCGGGIKTGEEEHEILPEDVVEMRDDQIVLANIETGTIEMRTINGRVRVNGIVTVAPQNFATVCAPMGGFIKSTSLMPGNAITKGQVLVVLENQEFVDIQQNYFEAKNKLEFAQEEYRRHSQLYKDDVYSEQNLQQVTADFKNLKAQVKALEQKLMLIGIDPSGLVEENISSSTNLIAPISGFLSNVNVTLGKYVNPTDVLFEIINNDQLFLELNLFEQDADKVIRGQKANFYINNESEEHKAVITQTGKAVNADKTCKVYANITGSCKNVLPGMYVNAVIETSGNNVAALPTDAIVSFADKDYIFVFDKNKEEDGKPFSEYKIIEVKKGATDGGFTEVVLPDGFDINASKVVIKGAYNLLAAKKNAGEMAC